MDDERVKAALDRLVPPPAAEKGWDDVLRRARRIQRGRRRRNVVVATAAVALVLVGSLAAAGQIGSLLSRSEEPHLLLRAELRGGDGSGVGTIELELPRAAIAFGPRLTVRLLDRDAKTGRGSGAAPFPARWFLHVTRLHRELASGSLYVQPSAAHAGSAMAILCAPCRPHDSGQIDLSRDQASALVNDEVAFAVATKSEERAATGLVALQRSHLRRGLMCTRGPARRLRCTRIYTGRS